MNWKPGLVSIALLLAGCAAPEDEPMLSAPEPAADRPVGFAGSEVQSGSFTAPPLTALGVNSTQVFEASFGRPGDLVVINVSLDEKPIVYYGLRVHLGESDEPAFDVPVTDHQHWSAVLVEPESPIRVSVRPGNTEVLMSWTVSVTQYYSEAPKIGTSGS